MDITEDNAPLQTKHSTANKNIPIENIIELKRKNLSHEQIAKLLKCSTTNITLRLAKYRDITDNLDRFKNHRADILAFNQQRLLNSITDAEIKKAPLGTKVLATCQLYDKERLERGQSTENVSVKGITRNIAADVDRINQAIKALEDD